MAGGEELRSVPAKSDETSNDIGTPSPGKQNSNVWVADKHAISRRVTAGVDDVFDSPSSSPLPDVDMDTPSNFAIDTPPKSPVPELDTPPKSASEMSSPVDRSKTNTPETNTPETNTPECHSEEEDSKSSDEEEDEQKTEKKKEDEQKENEDKETKPENEEKDQEVILIQDTSFTIKIQAPGVTESFELQVSSMELVQEIHQVLMDREDTCHRTCFSLHIDGREGALDAFSELKTIPELTEGTVVKVVEEPYTIREARIHVRHVRDLLKSVDLTDAYIGHDGSSLSVLNHLTGGDVTMTLPDTVKRRSRIPDSIDCTPPEYIMPGTKTPPLAVLHPISAKDCRGPVCLKGLSLSGWNPPPGNYRMQGDLLYLYIITLEDKRFHVTSSTKGFFLNECTEDTFNPRAVEPKLVFHSLIDLCNQLSPHFRKNFASMTKRRVNKHPFERVATPYQVYTWLSPVLDHSVDSIRAEDAFSSKLGYEEHLPAQTRDWNEELQTTRELGRKSLPDRLIRERAMFKVHSDFVMAATKGAMSVVDGNVMAINPGEDPKMQMYIWNNIFFSLGFDVKDHYKDFGGDAAAYSAPANDLQGVKAYSSVDMEGLYTLGTVVLDYRGYRVTAQSIIPGILDREQEQSVVYGSIDFGKTVVVSEKYQELLRKTAAALKIHPHKVVNDKDESVELVSSIECKGIVGNDGRHYILDLLRTFPPDINFLKPEGEDVGPISKEYGFPVEHKHKLVCLRQELIEAFVEARYVQFVKHAAMQFQQLRFKQQFIDRRLSMLKAEEPRFDVNELNTNDVLEKEQKSTDVNANLATPLDAPDGAPDGDGSHKDALTSAMVPPACDLQVIDLDSKKRGESEEREIKEAKKIVESFVPGSTHLAGIKESGGGKEEAEEQGEEKEEKETEAAEDASFDNVSKDIVRRSAAAVRSLKENEFDIRFNPDIFQAGVRHSQGEEEKIIFEKEKQLIKDAADFVLAYQIPSLIRDSLDHTSSPIDGVTLTDAMHQRGINMRYLGKLAERLAKIPQLDYFRAIVVVEILCRSAKHVFQAYLQSVHLGSSASAVAHFLNCFLDPGFGDASNTSTSGAGDAPNTGTSASGAETKKSSKKRKGKNRKSVASTSTATDGNEWMALNSVSLWARIRKDAEKHFIWKFAEDESVDSFCETYPATRVSILRNFCLKVGLQLQLREFLLDPLPPASPTAESRDSGNSTPTATPTNAVPSRKSPLAPKTSIFATEDILGMYPIVKHINPKATDAYHFFTSGQAKVQQGLLKEGYELISEALNLLNNVYGAMHPEIAACLRLLARLNYIMGDYGEALCFQQKAVLMTERVLGLDHPHTITEYANLALYCFANGHVTSALRLFYRARYLALLCHGELHPEVGLFDSNIGLILHAVGEFDFALKFLENALELNKRYFGEQSLKTALSCHFVARVQSCRGDFRSALTSEKETYAIYKSQLGEDHEKTKESSECLKHLTKQAVIFQKKMNEIYKGEKNVSLPPIQVQPPSLSGVLDLLNVINGILFVHVSQKELESIRTEIRQQQQQQQCHFLGGAPATTTTTPAAASAKTVAAPTASILPPSSSLPSPAAAKQLLQNHQNSAVITEVKTEVITDAVTETETKVHIVPGEAETNSSEEMDEGVGSGDEIIEMLTKNNIKDDLVEKTPDAGDDSLNDQTDLVEMSHEDLD